MARKTVSLRPSSSKDTFASMLAREFNDNERSAGNGASLLLFSRKNAMLGSLPWTSSLRRVGLRRGAPRHSLQSQQRGFVRQFGKGPHADIRAHRTTAKIAKNNSKHRTNLMHMCLGAHVHVSTCLTRYLAKTCNKFKSTAVGAYASTSSTISTTLGTKISAHPPHPCINTDGQFLAASRAPMPATLALHKDTSSTLQTRKPWQSQWYTHNAHPNRADNQTNITGLFITTTHEDSWNRYQDSLDFDMSSQPTHDLPDSEMTPIIEKQIQDAK